MILTGSEPNSSAFTINELIPVCVAIGHTDIAANLRRAEPILEREASDSYASVFLAKIITDSDNISAILSTIRYIGDHLIPSDQPILRLIERITTLHGNGEVLVTNLKNALEKSIDPVGTLKEISKITTRIGPDGFAVLRSLIEIIDPSELTHVVRIINDSQVKEMPSHLLRARAIGSETMFQYMHRAMRKTANVQWGDVFSHGQFESKLWLIEELTKLNRNLGTIYLCGGWVGSLAYMMGRSELKFSKIRSFDIDPECAVAADTFNQQMVTDQWRFKAQTYDMFDISYTKSVYETIRMSTQETVSLTDSPSTIINTSTEHINHRKWLDLIPFGKLVVMQNNDFTEVADHINTHATLEEFVLRSNLTTVLYAGELQLPQYKRFMLIGVK